MIITCDKNRCVIANMRRINKNYNVIKYWSRKGSNIKLKENDRYIWRFDTKQPYLADISKKILYSWITTAKPDVFDYKFEMIPSKWHVKQAQLISKIIRKEFAHAFNNTIKEIDIELNFKELFEKYKEAKEIYANTDIFETNFINFYNRYGKENYVVELLNIDTFKDNVKKYFFL